MRRWTILALALLLASRAALSAEADPPERPGLALPVALNILPGLGVGSFVQRDTKGGFLGLGGELLGFGAAEVGMALGIANILGVMFSGMTGEPNGASGEGIQVGWGFAIGGMALWVGTKIFEIARPFWYARHSPEAAPPATGS